MINAIRSDHRGFKPVEFTSGMNIILAERTMESTKKDSRNGLGKTTLIDIIHFCLGASTQKGKGLLREPLAGWTFFLDLDLKGKPYTVARNTENPGRVVIEGDTLDWPIKPRADTKSREKFLMVRDWNEVLGWLMFEIDIKVKDSKYTPQFRSLISYFIRKGRDAFSTPFEHFRKQLEWDIQVHNLFLLGLDWEYAQQWQILKDKEDTLKNLKEAAKTGLVSNLLGSIGELETSKVRLDEHVRNIQNQIESFQVHPQYREIEEQANDLTTEIHQLSNDNVADRRTMEYYESCFNDEKPASSEEVINIYSEIGIALPDRVVKRLDDVLEFHQRITANRKSFLQAEIDRLELIIAERRERIRIASETRASLMTILQSHGALEEYTKLQQKLTEEISQLDEVNSKIENLKKFEEGKSAVRIEKETLQLEARRDYDERRTIRERAISLFNGNSEALYMAPGKLIIDVTNGGFKFQVEIERSGSQGIEQMKIFCYDLMLAQLWSYKDVSPTFLIHDSTLFDGVDERQVAQALELATEDAEKYNFQYICCLNSDLIPWNDFNKNFDLKKYVRLTLTDASQDGGLLGVRF